MITPPSNAPSPLNPSQSSPYSPSPISLWNTNWRHRHCRGIPRRNSCSPPLISVGNKAVEQPRTPSLTSLSSSPSCDLPDRRPKSVSPQNRSAGVSPERTDAITASSRPSSASQEAIATAVHTFELAVLFCVASATPSPSLTTRGSPSSSSSTPSPDFFLAGEPSLLPFFYVPSIQIRRPRLEAHTKMVSTSSSRPRRSA
jgi:hypothetical protein